MTSCLHNFMSVDQDLLRWRDLCRFLNFLFEHLLKFVLTNFLKFSGNILRTQRRQPFVLALHQPFIQSTENRGEKCHRFWLRLRHAVILISNVGTSASKKINLMALIRTLTISTTTFERMKEQFYDFRQTV